MTGMKFSSVSSAEIRRFIKLQSLSARFSIGEISSFRILWGNNTTADANPVTSMLMSIKDSTQLVPESSRSQNLAFIIYITENDERMICLKPFAVL